MRVPPNPCSHRDSQPCHRVPSMPPAPRACPWQGWGLTVGLGHPRVGTGVGGQCQGDAKGPCLAPTEAAAASRPRAGKAPLGWNICSMRSWFAETARSPRQRLREVTRPGVTAGRWLLVTVVPVSPTPARGQAVLCGFGDTWGPRCGAAVGVSPSMGRVPGRCWAVPPSEGALLSPGVVLCPLLAVLSLSPGCAVPLEP